MTDAVEWRVEPGLIDYRAAVAAMEARAAAIHAGTARELIWLVEHPPLYTAGTSADAAELIDAARFPVFATGRGGRYTYHGPGQRVVYVMLDLNRRGRDVRRFVASLERWVIAALSELGVAAFTAPGRVGVWVAKGGADAKLGALGVRLRKWVSLHGFSINVTPDLEHFDGIVPCGLADFTVTSLADLGCETTMEQLDHALHAGLPQLLAALGAPAHTIGLLDCNRA